MYVVYDMPWSVQIEDQSSLQVTWNEQALHSCVLSAGFTLKNGGLRSTAQGLGKDIDGTWGFLKS
jgi:hypothetical protein